MKSQEQECLSTLPSKTDLKQLASKIVNDARDNVLATRVIRALPWSGKRRRLSRSVISFLVVFIPLLALSLMTSGPPGIAIMKCLSIAFLIVYSMEIVDYLRDVYVGPTIEDLLVNAECKGAVSDYTAWFEKLFTLTWQWQSASLGGLFGLVSLLLGFHPLNWEGWIFIPTTGLALGFLGVHGFSFGICIPFLARVIARHPMSLYAFRPSDTPWLKNISRMFTMMCVCLSIGAAAAFPSARFLMPREATQARSVWFTWLLFSGTVILWSFIFPQWSLSKVIRAKKKVDLELILAALQRIVAFGPRWPEFPEVGPLLSAYTMESEAPETAVSLAPSLRLTASFLLYALSAAGSWVTLFGKN